MSSTDEVWLAHSQHGPIPLHHIFRLSGELCGINKSLAQKKKKLQVVFSPGLGIVFLKLQPGAMKACKDLRSQAAHETMV